MLYIKQATVGLKVSEEEEELGLDLAEHGEHEAYHDLFEGMSPMYPGSPRYGQPSPQDSRPVPQLAKVRSRRQLKAFSSRAVGGHGAGDHNAGVIVTSFTEDDSDAQALEAALVDGQVSLHHVADAPAQAPASRGVRYRESPL